MEHWVFRTPKSLSVSLEQGSYSLLRNYCIFNFYYSITIKNYDNTFFYYRSKMTH